MEFLDESRQSAFLSEGGVALLKCLDCQAELYGSRGDTVTPAYIHAATDFLSSLSAQLLGNIPSAADRERLFELVYRTWSQFAREAGLPAGYSPRHLETARNGAHYVFSLIQQVFVALEENLSAAWVDSLESHFTAYFVSRRLNESLQEAAANDREAWIPSPDTTSAVPALTVSLALAAPERTPVSAANQDAWSQSAEMLQTLSRHTRWSLANLPSELAVVALIQDQMLAKFILAVRTRIDYDSPTEGDYDLFFGIILEELGRYLDIHQDIRDGSPHTRHLCSLAVDMFIKLCVALRMPRYATWGRGCLAQLEICLERRIAQAR